MLFTRSARFPVALLTIVLCLGACSESGPVTDAPAAPAGPSAPVDDPVGDDAVAAGDAPIDAPATGAASGSRIAAGSLFRSAQAGVSLRMPDGVTGQFDPTSGTLSFADERNTLGGFVFGGSAGGVAAGASRAIRTLLPQLGLTIGQMFQDRINPDGSLTSQFSASGAGGELFLQLEVRQGASQDATRGVAGNYVAVLGNSGMNEASLLGAIAAEIAASAVFEQPAGVGSPIDLGGVVLEAKESSRSDNGSGSVIGGDESFLITCADGRYRFSSTSTTAVIFDDGGSGSTRETLEHEGLFESHADFAGNQLIAMSSTDQGTFVLNVNRSDGAVILDRTAYVQTGTSEQQCGV